MLNKDVFKEYNTEQWVIEENLCYMLQLYWMNYCAKRYNEAVMPENPVTFVKKFMQEETICNVDMAEKSKMDTLIKSEVIDSQCTIID